MESMFPFDIATIKLEFDFQPIKILMVKLADGKLYKYDKKNNKHINPKSYEFRQHLMESKDIGNMITVKSQTIDGLDTHDLCDNFGGFQQSIKATNKIN